MADKHTTEVEAICSSSTTEVEANCSSSTSLNQIGHVEDTDEEFLMILSQKGTVGILRYLSTHEKAHYSDFNLPVSVSTLNIRLRELLRLSLINHFLERKPVRKESYVITEKGRKTLEHLEALITLHKS